MSFEVCFTDPWLDDVPFSNPLAPQFMEVTIAGRAYVLDTSFEPYRRDAFRHRSIAAQRESISLDNIPGEGTVNTEGLWRREAWDWHYGAGQPYQDRKDSIDSRFSVSKGVNPWMQWQLELLDDTEQILATPDPAQVLAVGQFLMVLIPRTGNVYAMGPGTNGEFVEVLSAPWAGLSMMATDGYNLWIGSFTGVYATNTAQLVGWYQYVTSGAFPGLWYVGDRLMAANGPNVYNIISGASATPVGLTTALTHGSAITTLVVTNLPEAVTSGDDIIVGPVWSPGGTYTQTFVASGDASVGDILISVTSQNANFDYPAGVKVVDKAWGTPPAALWTHPNPNFLFSAMTAGSSQIYMAGYDSTGYANSLVYRTTIEATGAALTVPVQALPLEGGEYCTSLYGYLNYIFVGTNLGVRMCRTIAAYDPTGNEGDLEAGPIYPGLFPPGPVAAAVDCIVGNNRFVYFGWSNYDSESTGIGRSDLSTFIDTQAPAFAADLMVSGQGGVSSMDWNPNNNSPAFVVEGLGVYTSTNSPVESGYVSSGSIGYGIADSKIALAGNIGTVQPQSGSVSMAVSSDNSSNIYAFIGKRSGDTPNPCIFPMNAVRGELFGVQLTLQRDPVTSLSPVVNRWMLKAIPAITAGTTVSVVIRMWQVEEIAGEDYFFNPYVEKAFLEQLRTTQTVFAYTEGPLTYPHCTVDEIDWLPEKRWDASSYGGFVGDIIVYIKTYDLGA